MRNFFITIAIVSLFPTTVFAFSWGFLNNIFPPFGGEEEFTAGAPVSRVERNIIPEADQTYDLGTTTPAREWNNIFTNNLTVSGTCTGCGGGSGASVFGDLTDVATSSDATGDVYYLNSSGQITNLGIGSDGQVLEVSSGVPVWGTDDTGAAGSDPGLVYDLFGGTTYYTASSTATDNHAFYLNNGYISQATSTQDAVLNLGEITAPTGDSNVAQLYASDNNGFTELSYVDSAGIDRKITHDAIMLVRNDTGATLSKGDLVYISGSTGNTPQVSLARANATTTAPADGMVIADIADNSFGQIAHRDSVSGLDTSAFSEGDELWLSPTTAGGLTNSEPEHPNLVQKIGDVAKSNMGSGIVHVNIDQSLDGISDGTVNDTFQIGNNNAGLKQLTFDGSTDASINWDGTSYYLNDGNVGIGTTTPAKLFAVHGDGLFSNTLSAANLTATGTLTVGPDSITSLDGDATLNIVSNNLRVVDLNCTGCIGDTELDGSQSDDDLSDDDIGALQNVDETGAAISNILMYNGSNWIAQATTTNMLQDEVSLAGSLDYLTISGQQITRNAVDLTTDVTGTLPIGSGGTNQTSFTTNQPLSFDGTSILSTSTLYYNIGGTGVTTKPADSEILVGNGAGYVLESGATARTSLGLGIGTDVQAFDAVLEDLSVLSVVADDEFIVGTGAGTYAHESGDTARISLGLGTTDSPTFTNLTLSSPGINSLASFDSNGTLVSTSTPTLSYLTATSTSATTTLAGGLNVGSGGLVYDHSSNNAWFNSGDVGIGTTDPNTKLVVSSASAQLTLLDSGSSDTSTTGGTLIKSADGLFTLQGINSSGSGSAIRFLVDQTNGDVGIGTTEPNEGKVEVKGDTVCVDTNNDDTASSCIASESDERLKTNVQTVDGALEKITQLRGVSFDWKVDDPEVLSNYPLIARFSAQPHSLGLISQEVEPIFPEAIMIETVGGEARYQQLNYDALAAPMVEAIKELDARTAHLVGTSTDSLAELGISDLSIYTETPENTEMREMSASEFGRWFEGLAGWAKLIYGGLTELGVTIADGAVYAADVFADRILTRTITAEERITTKELCVGDVCVTEEEFRRVFGDADGRQPTADSQKSSEDAEATTEGSARSKEITSLE